MATTNPQTREERAAVRTAALEYLAAGLSVLPIGGDKRPLGKWEHFQTERATPETVATWAGPGVGILGGSISGNLWILDFDYHAEEIYPAWRALLAARYPALAAALEGAPVARTSKGYHVYLRLPEARRNETLAAATVEEDDKRKLEKYIETRGEGGYVVAPPSPHPSGARYQWLRPLNGDIPMLSPEQVDQLVEASRHFDKREARRPEERPERPHEESQAPAPVIQHKTTLDRGNKPALEELREMLNHIPAWGITYEEWVAVLMALHSTEPGPAGLALAEEWGEGKPNEIARKWKSFKKDTGGVGVGTLVEMAKRGGYKPSRRPEPTRAERELPAGPPPALPLVEGLREIVLVDTPQAAEALNAAGLPIRAMGLTGDRLTREYTAALEEAGVERVLVATRPQIREETLRGLLRAKRIEGLLVVTWPGEGGLEQLEPAAAAEAIASATRAGAWLAEHLTAGIDSPLSDLEEERVLGRAAELYTWLRDREPLQAAALISELCERLDIAYTEIRPRLERAGERKTQEEARDTLDSLLRMAARTNAAGDATKTRELIETATRVMASGYVEWPRAYTLAALEADLLHEPESIPLPWEELNGVMFPRAGLSVIAAKSGHGKTTMMLNLLERFLHYPALAEESLYFFTYEEPASHIGLKLLMLLSGVELHDNQNFDAFRSYMRRRATPEPYPVDKSKRQGERIEEALQTYDRLTASGRLVISDRMPRLGELTATLELIARRGRAAAVFVDYVQRIPAPVDYKAATRQLELAYIVQELRATAVQYGLAIITGSQINDQGELREARDIYHEAQVVLQLEAENLTDDALKVRVDKQRSGVSNIEKYLQWDRPTLRITGKSGGAAATTRRMTIIEE